MSERPMDQFGSTINPTGRDTTGPTATATSTAGATPHASDFGKPIHAGGTTTTTTADTAEPGSAPRMGHDTARDTSARDTSGTTIPGTASTAGVGETTEKGEKPSKMHAFLEKAKGTVEKTVGKLTGSTTMQATGEERKFAAETERAAADANRGGATERASGRVERDAGVMAGQPGMASEGEMRREKGAAKQSGMMGAGGERDVGAGTTEGTPAGTETPAAGAAGSGFRGDPLVEKQYL